MKKYQHYINVRERVLLAPLDTKTAVATSEYSGKIDPSEIERTYKIRKQQTLFYLVCS